jgi:hypothetical protein
MRATAQIEADAPHRPCWDDTSDENLQTERGHRAGSTALILPARLPTSSVHEAFRVRLGKSVNACIWGTRVAGRDSQRRLAQGGAVSARFEELERSFRRGIYPENPRTCCSRVAGLYPGTQSTTKHSSKRTRRSVSNLSVARWPAPGLDDAWLSESCLPLELHRTLRDLPPCFRTDLCWEIPVYRHL